MKNLLKTTIVSLTIAATALATMPANAGERWHHHRHHKVQRHHSDKGDLVAAGILGLAVGALVVGAMSQPRRPAPVVRHAPYPPRYGHGYNRGRYDRSYYPPAPSGYRVSSYRTAPEPWTQAWYEQCRARYRSFDAGSGTFMGYDGKRHFCVIR